MAWSKSEKVLENLRELELLALAKEWTTVQKISQLRLSLPPEIDDQLCTALGGSFPADLTQEAYNKVKL